MLEFRNLTQEVEIYPVKQKLSGKKINSKNNMKSLTYMFNY